MSNQELEELQAAIELGEQLRVLKKNKAFKRIIQDYYLDEGVKNLSLNLPVVKEDRRQVLYDDIFARGVLSRFLMEIEQNAGDALQVLSEDGKGE